MVHLRYALLLAALAGTATLANTAPEVSVSLTSTTLSVDADGDGRADAGDSIRYEGIVSSTGDAAVTSVTISVPHDPNLAGDASTIFSNVIAIDDAVDTDEDTPVTVPAPGVAANDIDYPLPVSLSVTATTSTGVLGQVSINGAGELTYDPDGQFESLAAGQSAAETLTYAVTDAQDNTDTATVTVNVTGVNDAPVAVSQSDTTDEDTPLEITLAGTDIDVGTTLTFSIVSGPAAELGTLSAITLISATSAQVTFTPNPALNSMSVGQSQLGSFMFKVNDGIVDSPAATVGLTVTGANDAPTFVAGSRESFQTIGNTQFMYADASDIDTPHVFLAGSLKSNYTDPDASDTLTMSLVGSPSSGAVTINSDGTFVYTPAAGNTAAATFTYRVSDGNENVDRTATITHSNMVWYVKNNATPGGTGVSSSPYNLLTNVQAPSAANDYIFVYVGDGTSTNQSSGVFLKQGQRLLGEPMGLSIPVSVNAGANPTVLVAPNGGLPKPLVANNILGGNAVLCSNASNAVPAEIAGLSLSASSNAIDLTIAAANGATGSLSIHDILITNAGLEGIDINHSGTGAVTVSMQNNTIACMGTAIDGRKDSTGNLTLAINNHTNLNSSGASGINLDGATGTGALTVTSFLNNTISGNTAGQGISANTVRFDSNTGTAGWQTVGAGTTAIGQSGNGVGGSGLSFSNVTGDLQFTGLSSFADGAAAVSIVGNGTFNAAAATGLRIDAGPAATAVANAGTALSYTSLAALGTYSSITSTNAGASGVSLGSVSGTVAITAGTITNAAAADFAVNTCTATITYGGTIADSTGQMVSINGCSGGSTSFSGALGNSGANTGGAISLVTNPNTTINFTGGLTCNTGATAAFTATGGGTVNVTGTNKLTASSATALDVQNTIIGGSGLTFRSISSGAGANNGINLVSTGSSGGLTVTGLDGVDAGTDPDVGSGGIITGKTGGDGSTSAGSGVFLSSTNNVSLNGMTITNHQNYGIRGAQVDGFRLTFSLIGGVNGTNEASPFGEGSVSFIGTASTGYGLRGSAAFLDNEITGGFQRNVSIDNATGTMNLNFLRNNVHHSSSGNSGDDGLAIEVDTSAVMFANVSNNTFTAHRGDHFNLSLVNNANADLTFKNNDMQGGAVNPLGQGVFILGAAYNGTFKYDVSNNGTDADPFTGNVQGAAIFVNKGSGTGTYSGQITNNVIGNPAVTGSGTAQAVGIHASARGAGGSHTTLITNNKVRQYYDRGIVLEAGEGSPNFTATVTNNTVSNFADAINSLHGIHCDFGILAADNAQITVDVRNNLIANAGNEAQGGVDFRMRTAGFNDTFIAGYAGGNSGPNAQAFIDGVNPDGTSFSVSQAASGTYNNGPSSPLPTPNLPSLPPAP